MIESNRMDFDRPYAKTTSIDGPPHYLQDGKMFSMNGDEIVTGGPVEEITTVIDQPEENRPKKRGPKPKEKNGLAN